MAVATDNEEQMKEMFLKSLMELDTYQFEINYHQYGRVNLIQIPKLKLSSIVPGSKGKVAMEIGIEVIKTDDTARRMDIVYGNVHVDVIFEGQTSVTNVVRIINKVKLNIGHQGKQPGFIVPFTDLKATLQKIKSSRLDVNEWSFEKIRSILKKKLYPAIKTQYEELWFGLMPRFECMKILKFTYTPDPKMQGLFAQHKSIMEKAENARASMENDKNENNNNKNKLYIDYQEKYETVPAIKAMVKLEEATAAHSDDFGDFYIDYIDDYSYYEDVVDIDIDAQQQELNTDAIHYNQNHGILYHQFFDVEILILMVIYVFVVGLFCCLAGFVVGKASEEKKQEHP